MKKVVSIVLIMLLLLSGMPMENLSIAATEDQIDMIVHYHRFDEQYEGWNLWIWAKGKDGQSFEFNAEDAFGKRAEFTLEGISGAEEIGFIVRKGEWEAKDVETDRFVRIDAKNQDGKLEIFLVQGVENAYFNESEIDLSPKFIKAGFIDETTVRLVTSKPISPESIRNEFSVISESGAILKPTAVSAPGNAMTTSFVVLLDGKVTVGERYTTDYPEYEPLGIDISGLFDTDAFEKNFTTNEALGAIYTKSQTTFRVWAPTAEALTLNLYAAGNGGTAKETLLMQKATGGVWEATKAGDLHGLYYTFSVTRGGKVTETYDPYAKAAGVNGDRSMVVDFERTHPEGWTSDQGPAVKKQNDIIVYELHIRDLSSHASSGIQNVGKFLGVVEKGTTSPGGVKTGLDHLKELGITHVQLLPMVDFNSIDETALEEGVFNWGYDPKNYSLPEGSYSTDPYNGEVRIKEMKQMIKGLHDEGIGVIMDVVYNHTALSADSNLTILEPNYYYRMIDGKYSNASGTGNETASERAMVRKLMIDSLVHWVTEYHIDGFRFDLMGVHDIETMKLIEETLRAIKPDIVLYGEGWTGGTSPLADGLRLLKANMQETPGIGAFNDDFRDGIKGHVFNATEGGFAGGFPGLEESVKFGIVGAVTHPQINYRLVNYSKKPWAENPSQAVNYVSAHDNLTLWDKFMVTNPEATDEQRIAMHKLSNAIVLTSQGMPFLHAGVDFLRTKQGDHNSYKSPDAINSLDWTLKEQNTEVFEYYKGLIALRKAYPAFSMASQAEVEKALHFFSTESDSEVVLPEMMIGYKIDAAANTTTNQNLFVFFNGSLEPQTISIPAGKYRVLANASQVNAEGIETIMGGTVQIAASSSLILESADGVKVNGDINGVSAEDQSLFIGIGLLALIAAGAGYTFIKKRKK